MSEEEDRRRCILDPSTCKPPMTQVTALAEVLAEATGWSAHSDEKSEGLAYTAAKYLLAHYDLKAPVHKAEAQAAEAPEP